jgi:cytoskeletal protein RodZ
VVDLIEEMGVVSAFVSALFIVGPLAVALIVFLIVWRCKVVSNRKRTGRPSLPKDLQENIVGTSPSLRNQNFDEQSEASYLTVPKSSNENKTTCSDPENSEISVSATVVVASNFSHPTISSGFMR